MGDMTLSMDQLRGLIGRRLHHHGVECQVIELLEDGPSLILQECAPHTVIQSDQHGEAHRRVAPTYAIPAWDSKLDAPNPLITALLGSS
jgi:hypothetical protein